MIGMEDMLNIIATEAMETTEKYRSLELSDEVEAEPKSN